MDSMSNPCRDPPADFRWCLEVSPCVLANLNDKFGIAPPHIYDTFPPVLETAQI